MGSKGGGGKRFMARYVRIQREEIEEDYQSADTGLSGDITTLSGSTAIDRAGLLTKFVSDISTLSGSSATSRTSLIATLSGSTAASRASLKSDTAASIATLSGSTAASRASLKSDTAASVATLSGSIASVTGSSNTDGYVVLEAPNGDEYKFGITVDGTPYVEPM